MNLVQPLRAEDFLQQVWVDVSTGTKVFPRIKLGPVPLAIGSQNADRRRVEVALVRGLLGNAFRGPVPGPPRLDRPRDKIDIFIKCAYK